MDQIGMDQDDACVAILKDVAGFLDSEMPIHRYGTRANQGRTETCFKYGEVIPQA
jgi:hypothetical protein